MSWIETVGIVHVFAFGLACGGVLVDLRGQKREAARIEQDSKERDAEIERRLERGVSDGDRSTATRLDKLETTVERMEERLDDRFEKMTVKIEDVVTALSGKVSQLTTDVQKLNLTKQSNPRMAAQTGAGGE